MDGGGGTDTVSYADAGDAITISLAVCGPQDHRRRRHRHSCQYRESHRLARRRHPDRQCREQCHQRPRRKRHAERGAGNDTLDGGDGDGDTASYVGASSGVTVSLLLQGTAQNTLGAGVDTLTNFENLTGSALNDTLTGDDNNNVISGLAGNDTLNGGNGDDTLDGGTGSDTASYADAASAVTVSLALQRRPGHDAVPASTP